MEEINVGEVYEELQSMAGTHIGDDKGGPSPRRDLTPEEVKNVRNNHIPHSLSLCTVLGREVKKMRSKGEPDKTGDVQEHCFKI